MRKASIFVALAAIAALAGFSSAATASPPGPVHIELYVSAFCCPEVGT